jgi:hypothetical protein
LGSPYFEVRIPYTAGDNHLGREKRPALSPSREKQPKSRLGGLADSYDAHSNPGEITAPPKQLLSKAFQEEFDASPGHRDFFIFQ